MNPGCSWWKKLPRSSDFHQNGFARERKLVGVDQDWKVGKNRPCRERQSKRFWKKSKIQEPFL